MDGFVIEIEDDEAGCWMLTCKDPICMIVKTRIKANRPQANGTPI